MLLANERLKILPSQKRQNKFKYHSMDLNVKINFFFFAKVTSTTRGKAKDGRNEKCSIKKVRKCFALIRSFKYK